MSQIQFASSQYRRYPILMIGLTAIAATVLMLGNVSVAFGEVKVGIDINSDTQGCELTESCYTKTGLIIPVGETVTWENFGNKAHSIVSGSAELGDYGLFNSGVILPDEKFSHTFSESGQYFYYCKTHPWMSGIVMAR